MNGYNEFYNSENDGYRGGFEPERAATPMHARPRSARRGGLRAAALLLACALVGGAAGVGGAALYQRHNPVSSGGGTTVIQQEERTQVQTVVNTNGGQAMTPEQLYAANLASCVGITVNTEVNIYGYVTTSPASGSGFVLSQDGYIVTNYHVIEDAVENSSITIEVSFADGNKYNAKLVGGAKDNDVAVLKIDATGLQPVTLGDSDKLVVGQSVYAIGNPLGELTYSFTDGMVSALDRLITTGSGSDSTTLNVLQTNCAINPGNSGGPLFDSYGSVIGITTAKYTQSQSGVTAEGLGFALPINDVKNLFSDLIEHGYVTGRPYMGIQVKDVSSEAQSYGITAGAVVSAVGEGSCAEKAGLRVNDIITAIDSTAIDSTTALTAALSTGYRAGDTATLTVVRQQQEVNLSITFDEKNAETEARLQQSIQKGQGNQSGGGRNDQGGQDWQNWQDWQNMWPFGGFFW